MRKTIFSQFMSACLVLIIFCTVLMSTFGYVLVRNHLIAEQTDEMTDTADFVSNMVTRLLDDYNAVYNSFYNFNINFIADRSKSSIVITDYQGNVILKSNNYEFRTRKIDMSSFDKLKSGEKQVKKGAFDKLFSEKTVTVSAPIIYRGSLFGAVFITLPIDYVYKNGEEALGIFGLIAIFALFTSIVLSYVLSARIAKPIKNLSLASREIAKGSFGKRAYSNSAISEIQELETTFNSMASELETQIIRRTDFISNVSHDLRTPMTTICGFVEAVLDGTVTEEQRENYLKIVLSETKRLSSLVKSLLDVATYGEGSPVIEKSEFDINESIRTIILSLEKNITEKNLHVEFLFDNDESYVYAGKTEIHRVLQNLIENAVKFADEDGEIKIEIKHSGKKTYTSVSNTGKTIPETDKKFIFDRFYKADHSRTDKKSGFGLGLYIVKSIINAHKEDIRVKSADGVTTFTFTLPSA